MLSTELPKVFENESSFVYRKIVIGNVRAAIGTNVLRPCVRFFAKSKYNIWAALRKKMARDRCYAQLFFLSGRPIDKR